MAFLSEVPHIINRTRTGWCPLEHAVSGCIRRKSVYSR
ncbi:MAG: DUF1893 domain-containing protein [Butyricimonas faecalis]